MAELSVEEILREARTGQVLDNDVEPIPDKDYCRHGVYVGNIYTADYICGACEYGESDGVDNVR